MELVQEGLPLTTYARDYALSWQERLAVFVRVCHAVRYAHKHRVVHRDLLVPFFAFVVVRAKDGEVAFWCQPFMVSSL